MEGVWPNQVQVLSTGIMRRFLNTSFDPITMVDSADCLIVSLEYITKLTDWAAYIMGIAKIFDWNLYHVNCSMAKQPMNELNVIYSSQKMFLKA